MDSVNALKQIHELQYSSTTDHLMQQIAVLPTYKWMLYACCMRLWTSFICSSVNWTALHKTWQLLFLAIYTCSSQPSFITHLTDFSINRTHNSNATLRNLPCQIYLESQPSSVNVNELQMSILLLDLCWLLFLNLPSWNVIILSTLAVSEQPHLLRSKTERPTFTSCPPQSRRKKLSKEGILKLPLRINNYYSTLW